MIVIVKRPEFMSSEYVDMINGKWIYDDDAPEEIKKAVDDWNKKVEKAKKEKLI